MKREFLFSINKKDLKIDYFSGKGAGGQHRNRHKNCVRLYHKDSKTRVTGQSNKERRSNVKEALSNLVKHPNFKFWLNIRVYESDKQKKTVDELVDEMMNSFNIKVETKENGRWVENEKSNDQRLDSI